MFPECFLTIDSARGKVYPADPMVNDVYAECNNHRISYIDNYAKRFIQTYFLNRYGSDEKLSIDYDLTKVQKMLLKYAYNDIRSRKDYSSFFADAILHVLMSEDINKPLRNITILAGLAVNISPAPDFVFGNQKLQWGASPRMLNNSTL